MSVQTREAELTSILDDLRRIVGVLRSSSLDAEREFGLSVAQLFVLKTLAEAPALTVSELARRTCTHQGTVAAVLQPLLGAELIERVHGSTELAVTTRGHALLARTPVVTQERLIGALEQLPGTERQAFASGLHKIVSGMLIDGERPVMFFEGDAGKSS